MPSSSILLAALMAFPTLSWTQTGPQQRRQPAPVVQNFVAMGPTSAPDLARLRESLEKVPGVLAVQLREGVGGPSLMVKGDVLFTTLAAAARPTGFTMRLMPSRHFAAKGPKDAKSIAGLRQALRAVPGVNGVAVSPDLDGAAVRVAGIAPFAEVAAAAATAGYSVRQLTSFTAEGSDKPADVERLRSAIGRTPRVEKVETQALYGGATLLIQGDIDDEHLASVAKSQGYLLRSLSNVARSQAEYIVVGADDVANQQKLRQVLEKLEGITEIEFSTTGAATRLTVAGERLKPDRVAAAAAEAGFRLEQQEAVTLPTLTPQAGRNTPAEYADAIVGDPVVAGELAPQFTLTKADGKTQISLSDYSGKKPVVLMFGSCS